MKPQGQLQLADANQVGALEMHATQFLNIREKEQSSQFSRAHQLEGSLQMSEALVSYLASEVNLACTKSSET
eukprot:6215559-Amphidinium_carterae.2